ncbi:MAG: AMP-binding protein [Polaribacter sp.]
MKQHNFHNTFQLNEHSFTSVDEILRYAHKFSEELYFFLKDWFSDTDYISVHTSGSTGKPKPIQLKKEFVKNSAMATGSYFNLQENTSVLLCLPITYIAGKMMLIRALVLGWQLDIVPPTSFPLEKIKRQYDFSAMIPLQLEKSIQKIGLIKKLIVGGSFVSKKLEDNIQNVSTEVFATYGMTETITHIAVKKLNNKSVSPTFYEVLPNVTIYKDDRDCLVIEAPKITDTVIFTNDVVKLISDTQFEWLGRFDNVINSGGIKLHPEKIEEKLAEIINERFFVAGISDTVLGEKLVLMIELESTKAKKLKNVIEEKINNLPSLSKFEIPKEIYFVNRFVETATRKIQRKKTLDLIGVC